MGFEPPCSDSAVKQKTGRGWDEWCSLLDAEGAASMTHAEIAIIVHDKYQGGSWWSQMVTVGYERSRGLRATGQGRNGAFSVAASKTLPVTAETAHAYFTAPEKRQAWLNEDIVIRKAASPKSVRISWPDETSVAVWITAKGAAKCSVAIEHTKLAGPDAIGSVQEFWKSALQRLAEVATA